MIKPAANSRATSSPMALHLSSLNRRRNCLIGLNFGSILRVCSASSLDTPGMSEGFHVILQPRPAGDLIHLAMDDRMHAPITVVACPREIFPGRRGAAGPPCCFGGAAGHLCYFRGVAGQVCYIDGAAGPLCCFGGEGGGLCAATAARLDMSAAFAARWDISRASSSMLTSPWWKSLDPELTLATA